MSDCDDINFFVSKTREENMENTPRKMEAHVAKRKKHLEVGRPKKEKSDAVEICHICHQDILDPKTKTFQGLPDGALEEEAALTDDRLQLHCDGSSIPEIDIKPLHKVTYFTVFDGEGHLCPFDTGLIESDELIFFSGYIKPIYEDDPSPENGVPAQELGPIVEWWISGYDGGNSFLLAFRSPYAEYILMEPSPEYSSFMRVPKQKALLSKIVIEFLNSANKPTYEELISRISEISVPEDIEPFDCYSLRKHAQFIVDQVCEVDCNRKLISTPAVQEMIKKYKIKIRKSGNEKKKSRFKSLFNVTTTALVRKYFQFFFKEEYTKGLETLASGSKKSGASTTESSPCKKLSKFTWKENTSFATVNDEIVSVKDFVFIQTNQPDKGNRIFRIERFFQQNFTKQVHCSEYIKGEHTLLGNASDPFEVFYLEECSDWPICKIMEKVNVKIMAPPKTWTDFITYQPQLKNCEWFLQKKYSPLHGSFENFDDTDDLDCAACNANLRKQNHVIVPSNGKTDASGRATYESLTLGKESYFPGNCIFLEPFSVVFDSQKSSQRIKKSLVTLKANEVIYPELYRKSKEVNLVEECPEPFAIGRIKNIFSKTEDSQKKYYFTINKFYRPENTRIIDAEDERLFDLRLLYWSKEECEVSFEHVRGICNVVYSDFPPQVSLGTLFYFNEGFDAENETFYDARDVLLIGKEKEPRVIRKLKTLNPFSGCGGLAEGLKQSGLADVLWAVENDKVTSKAYILNFPKVTMFENDCNAFLRDVLSGKSVDENGNRYPKKGEVELLCGGPPCQGFSTMNRFTSKEESQYNNSLILTYLSFCDYYRPKFFLMENVRNFVSYKKSLFLRHTLSCLNAMGYQCSLGVLQAGNYGLPQIRRRLFLIASAPGFCLPNFPKPTNVFFNSVKNAEYEVCGNNYTCKFSKAISGSAPFRNVTVRNAIFDMPSLDAVVKKNEGISDEPSFYSKFLLGTPSRIRDHVTKDISPLNEARIKHIPASKGCDWRDLPNIRVRLRDGTLTDLLKYSHHDVKNGKSSCGSLRGVCSCASGKACNSKDRQNNTLIPWFLVHTANRNNNWTGLYGRLDWLGAFNTVTTNPEPSNQQGKVLHPEENRIITVRECARAQGMPDSFRFHGNVAEKFKQVGNAVPPPMARAIGVEIKKCLLFEDEFSQI